jgi:hypothetical protein
MAINLPNSPRESWPHICSFPNGPGRALHTLLRFLPVVQGPCSLAASVSLLTEDQESVHPELGQACLPVPRAVLIAGSLFHLPFPRPCLGFEVSPQENIPCSPLLAFWSLCGLPKLPDFCSCCSPQKFLFLATQPFAHLLASVSQLWLTSDPALAW